MVRKRKKGYGYGAFTSYYGGGALHIERIDEIMDRMEARGQCPLFEDDREAAIAAEEDGVAIIKNLPVEEDDEDYAYYIDTPENRAILCEYFAKERGIIWE